MFVTLCVIFCVGAVVCGDPPLPDTDHAKYEGQTLLSVHLDDADQVAVMQKLHDDDSLLLDFFNVPSLRREITFLVPVESMKTVMKELKRVKVKPTTISNNFRELADRSLKQFRDGQAKRGKTFDPFAFTADYLTLTEINDILDNLARSFPSMIEVTNMGKSTEGRDLKQVHISSDFSARKPAIWLECLTHAREWITGAVCLYSIDRLVRGYGFDKEATDMLSKFDWYFIPVANPDGYEHSHTRDRNWRKNRRYVQGNCYGVDLNRNWKIDFGGTGSSSSCSSQTYKGTGPLSERETSLLHDAITATKARQGVVSFLAMHSYGQMILVPYGYKSDPPPDQPLLRAAANSAADELWLHYGTYFSVGTSGELLYLAGGCSDDHFKEAEDIQFSYTYELRPPGYPYFELDKSQIGPSQIETFASFHALAMYM